MHIISGELKGRTLKQPKDKNVRPTRELVRKAVFDVLGEFILDKEVLDLFSGSGAFGFEALSCGAKSVTFVEKNFLCQKVIKENMDLCGVQDRCALIERDVFQSLPLLEKRKQLFGIVFADPPYSGDI
ncbi:MAG: RsmD family RNA methyltransferase [Candidatus Omnitrophica bacterium]|nr:RsmD family RNA methyltransferase [Candidatus Omnitrophota bacterium]